MLAAFIEEKHTDVEEDKWQFEVGNVSSAIISPKLFISFPNP
jgi:hypothetical protein